MQRMVANEAFPYAGRDLARGEQFEASDEDAKVLKILRRASDAIDPPAPEKIETAAMKPESGELFEEQNKPKPKRNYKRRDMRAEN